MTGLLTSYTLKNQNNIMNVLGKMRKDKDFKAKEKRVDQISMAIMQGITSLPEDQRTDADAIFNLVQDKLPEGATAAELKAGLELADYAMSRARGQVQYDQGQRKVAREEDAFRDEQKDARLLDQMEFPKPQGVPGVYEAPPGEPEDYRKELSYGTRQAVDQNELQKKKAGLEVDLLEKKIDQVGRPKPPSLNDQKYVEQKAMQSLNAKLQAAGASIDPESGMVNIETDEKGMPLDKNIFNILSKSGFEFTSGDPVETESNWFSKDKYARPIYLGAFIGNSPGASAPPAESNQAPAQNQVQGDRPPLDRFNGPSQGKTRTPKLVDQTADQKDTPTPQIDEIGSVDGKTVGRSAGGYVVNDGEGWRKPTKEESKQILLAARKGQLQSKGWSYETKYKQPDIDYSEMAKGYGRGRGNSLTKSPRQ